LASDLVDETPWKKLNDGKQPFLCSHHFTVLFWLVQLGLHTLVNIDCACFKIKKKWLASAPLFQIT